jgi:hypothetical protein
MRVIIDRLPIDHAENLQFLPAIVQLLQYQTIPAKKSDRNAGHMKKKNPVVNGAF